MLIPALVRFGLSPKYEPLYAESGARWKVAPEKLHALALTESRENPTALHVNSDGSTDYGMMQINSTNLARLGLTAATAMDPAHSVEAAAQLLAEIEGRNAALLPWDQFSAYNAGLRQDPTTGAWVPHTRDGVYVDLGYVIEATAWWVVVWLARLSLIRRTV